jgi:hypothetical protein
VAKDTCINYYTAVLQVLTSDTGRAFSISEIISVIAENHPMKPDRRSVVNALAQLKQVPLVTVTSERRYMRSVPVSLYQYKL